jgi:hypothetical protein
MSSQTAKSGQPTPDNNNQENQSNGIKPQISVTHADNFSMKFCVSNTFFIVAAYDMN